ncbi:MAG: hypothetical protein ACLQU3_05820 [Limisphaerales bacterium]
MPARQLHLFAPPKPLMQRLGDAFPRAAPREPGVCAPPQLRHNLRNPLILQEELDHLLLEKS